MAAINVDESYSQCHIEMLTIFKNMVSIIVCILFVFFCSKTVLHLQKSSGLYILQWKYLPCQNNASCLQLNEDMIIFILQICTHYLPVIPNTSPLYILLIFSSIFEALWLISIRQCFKAFEKSYIRLIIIQPNRNALKMFALPVSWVELFV